LTGETAEMAVPGVRAVAVAVAATPAEAGRAEREAAEEAVMAAAAWEVVARAQVR